MTLNRRNAFKLCGALVVALCLALSGSQLLAQSGKVEVHWLGQATFKITTPGGKVQPFGPQIEITQVRAEHSSELTVADPATKKTTTHPGGEPAGFIIQVENGFKVYHMGDTGLFGDMKLIAD
ncbi:MAG: hypothetical protein DMD94_21515, partial [Candidatus Rokuibacteriota bacterium]